MFTQNMFEARGLSTEQVESTYFLLYYQFIKHAFGFMNHPRAMPLDDAVALRVYLDLIPDTDEKKQKFKSYICALRSNPEFRSANITIDPTDVTDVDSREHDILQCLDIILGSMQFRLNDKHLEKAPGSHRRGKRTVAKDNVYKAINARIRAIRSNFNVGISTGTDGDLTNRWHHAYRHWNFVPTDHQIVRSGKHKREAAPS